MKTLLSILVVLAATCPLYADVVVLQEDFNGTPGTSVDGWNGWVLAGGDPDEITISSTVIDSGNSAAVDTGHGLWYTWVDKTISFSPPAGTALTLTGTMLCPDGGLVQTSDYADLSFRDSSDPTKYLQIALGYDYLIFGDSGPTAQHIQPMPTTATDVRLVVTDSEWTGSYKANGTSVWTVGPTLAHTVPISGYDTINLSGAGQPFMDSIQLMGTGTVPEPTTLVLVLTGLIGLLAYAWRKRK